MRVHEREYDGLGGGRGGIFELDGDGALVALWTACVSGEDMERRNGTNHHAHDPRPCRTRLRLSESAPQLLLDEDEDVHPHELFVRELNQSKSKSAFPFATEPVPEEKRKLIPG